MIRCLEIEVVVELNRTYTNNGGYVRDRNGLEGALSRPMQTFDGNDLHPTVVDKAAALLSALASTQYFVDGNKRTAWMSCVTFLAGAGLSIQHADEEADEFVVAVAQTQLSHEDIVSWILERLNA